MRRTVIAPALLGRYDLSGAAGPTRHTTPRLASTDNCIRLDGLESCLTDRGHDEAEGHRSARHVSDRWTPYLLVELPDGLLEDAEVGSLGGVLGPAPPHQVHHLVLTGQLVYTGSEQRSAPLLHRLDDICNTMSGHGIQNSFYSNWEWI